jgi:hypothetical protein
MLSTLFNKLTIESMSATGGPIKRLLPPSHFMARYLIIAGNPLEPKLLLNFWKH